MAEKIQMPSSMGGIVRYNEETGSRFKFKPGHIIILCISIIIIMIILHLYGRAFLGI